jgi:glycosyltransferase involved in cell wall biosynthesis
LHVEFAGEVPYYDIGRWMTGADALFFPTMQDEWGLVVNEALVQGLPVLGSRAAESVVEFIRDDVNGYTFDPGSSHEMREAIVKFLFADQMKMDELSRGGLKTIGDVNHVGLARVMLEAVETSSRWSRRT